MRQPQAAGRPAQKVPVLAQLVSLGARLRPMVKTLSAEDAASLATKAATAFLPRTPISTQALFAGRWTQIEKIGDTVTQIGLHAVVFGERGVGKTSLTHVIRPVLHVLDEAYRKTLNGAQPETEHSSRIVVRVNANGADTFSSLWRKAFDEIIWYNNKPSMVFDSSAPGVQEQVTLRQALGLDQELTIDSVQRTLRTLAGSVFIFDEYDRLPKGQTSGFTDLIKHLSDAATQSTIVLVGVAETVDGLMMDHASIGRALFQIHMPRMNEAELGAIIQNAEKSLIVEFDPPASAQIIRMSQGLPHFTHLLGLHAVRSAARARRATVTIEDVHDAFEHAVSETDQTVKAAYNKATQSAQPGARYAQVLLAAAVAAYVSSDSMGWFQPSSLLTPMRTILGPRTDIATYNQHLTHFTESKRASILERTGKERSYRFRFTQPLVPPYVIMRSIGDKIVATDVVDKLLAEE